MCLILCCRIRLRRRLLVRIFTMVWVRFTVRALWRSWVRWYCCCRLILTRNRNVIRILIPLAMVVRKVGSIRVRRRLILLRLRSGLTLMFTWVKVGSLLSTGLLKRRVSTSCIRRPRRGVFMCRVNRNRLMLLSIRRRFWHIFCCRSSIGALLVVGILAVLISIRNRTVRC